MNPGKSVLIDPCFGSRCGILEIGDTIYEGVKTCPQERDLICAYIEQHGVTEFRIEDGLGFHAEMLREMLSERHPEVRVVKFKHKPLREVRYVDDDDDEGVL